MKVQQKISIKLRAFDHKLLDVASGEIVRTVKRTGAGLTGPIPLPVDKKIYTVIRGPHVNKTSREQFMLNTHKRLMIIKSTTPQTVEALKKVEIPSGVDVEVKLLGEE
jgi:small subunit ribosomal protein S10